MANSKRMTLLPESSKVFLVVVTLTSIAGSATLGYDSSMMNALNILPSYTDYFYLTTATLALNTCAVSLGGALSGPVGGYVADYLGRRWAIALGAFITLVAIVIQTASQATAMFVVARILIGFGVGIENTAIAIYVGEVTPYNYRDYTMGFFNDCWYVGALVSSGVTYGTAKMNSTWAWRLPSVLQSIFSILNLILLPLGPESPRWLVYKERYEEALRVVALMHANGDTENPLVRAQYQEIVDTITFERENKPKGGLLETMRTRSNRKRMMLMLSMEVFTSFAGNTIVSYYLGTMLDNAGITDTNTQLQINIYLNLFCFVVAIIGTAMAPRIPRKVHGAVTAALTMAFLIMVGVMTKYFGNGGNNSGIYGTVAFIFLFQGAYSFGWTPLAYLYPVEVLNYAIRGSGVSISTFLWNAFGFVTNFAYPFALDALGWKFYMINGAFNFLVMLFIIFFWVETRGKTLEEIDELFDGEKHSLVPNIQTIARGKVICADEASVHDVPVATVTTAAKK